ncbi:MAG TPA: tetratricopeptide repeat protein [Polyangiaceae bacterium]
MSHRPATQRLLEGMGREVVSLENPSDENARRIVARLEVLHSGLIENRKRSRIRRGWALVALVALLPVGVFAALHSWKMTRGSGFTTPNLPARASSHASAPARTAVLPSPAVLHPTASDSAPVDPPQRGARAGAPAPSSAATSTLALENQLFSQAMLARRQRREDAALELLRELLAKYPRSVLAQEAQVEEFRALERQGRRGAATELARSYISRYPNGFAVEEARRLALDSIQPPP